MFGLDGPGLVALVALIGLFIWAVSGGGEKKPPPDVNDLVTRADAEKPAMLPTKARFTGRECFCPPGRWAAWKQGLEAGPDHEVGTADDIKVEETHGHND